MPRSRWLFPLLAALPFGAVLPAPALGQADAAAAIAEVNAAFAAAASADNVDAVVGFYTPGAMLMAPNMAAATGPDAIRAAFAEMLPAMGAIRLTTDELEVHGDTAHEIGRYVLDAADGSHLDHGKFVVIWKRTADGWRLHRDIFNSDMAPPTGG